MADNATLPIANGTVLAFDECVINGVTVLISRNKIGFGADGTYVEASAANPMPVAVDTLAPATSWFAINPADAALGAVPDSIYVGGSGNLVVRGSNNVDATFVVLAGTILPIRPTQVRAATTATGIIGLVN